MALLSRFFGRTASEGAAYALGLATGPVLAPATELVRQAAWGEFPDRALNAELVAAIVAEDVEQQSWGQAEAARYGINGERFLAVLGEVLNAPGLPELFELWRRDLISDTEFEHGLRKAKLETRWDAPLKSLKQRLLTPSELANARQQGFVDEARQKAEAALQGVDSERAEIQFELSGLPPGVDVMQRGANRGLVDEATFDQAVREGHTKTKYTSLLWQMRHPLLSAATYVRLFLKGWITETERDAGGALWGYTPEQMQQWYLSEGRPAAPTQMTTAWARGIDGPDGRPMDEAQFLKGVKESDIRPEWGPMLWGIRFSYPPLFQLGRLVQSGAITPTQAADWARKDRYAPEVVAALEAYWSHPATSAAGALTKAELLTEYEGGFISEADFSAALTALGFTGTALTRELELGAARRSRSYRDKVIAAIHDAYLTHDIDDAQASTQLATVNVVGDATASLLRLWQVERQVTIRNLTVAEIAKAAKKGIITHDAALLRLENLGLTPDDAAIRLAEA